MMRSLGTLRPLARLKRTKAVPLEYPTLALYRDILRAHQRYLPPDARELGDAYVRHEFTEHRNASADFMLQFERQWRDYLTTIRSSDTEEPIGRAMTADEVAALSDEQKVQLRECRLEAKLPNNVHTLSSCLSLTISCSIESHADSQDSRKYGRSNESGRDMISQRPPAVCSSRRMIWRWSSFLLHALCTRDTWAPKMNPAAGAFCHLRWPA